MDLDFEWDSVKAADNSRKHGVSFEEAASVLESGTEKVEPDPEHSLVEDRARAIGFSDRGRLIVVIFTERASVLRIISARRATQRESYWYAKTKS